MTTSMLCAVCCVLRCAALQVCGKQTGHAEVVAITFDPKVISFKDLLDVFFTVRSDGTVWAQRSTACHSMGTNHGPHSMMRTEHTLSEAWSLWQVACLPSGLHACCLFRLLGLNNRPGKKTDCCCPVADT